MTLADHHYRPEPDAEARALGARARRYAAANLAGDTTKRPAPIIFSNQEENAHFPSTLVTSFTKGLPHNRFGIVMRSAYEKFVKALTGFDTQFDVQRGAGEQTRRWESPLAGHYFDLEGPDAGSLAMAPVPRLGSGELTAEIAEIYAMALVRDMSFVELADRHSTLDLSYPAEHPEKPGKTVTVADLIDELNKLAWFDIAAAPQSSYTGKRILNRHEQRRRAARLKHDTDTGLSAHSLFRGSVPGAKDGPYISQFLLIGTEGKAVAECADNSVNSTAHGPGIGSLVFGAQSIEQRIYPHAHGKDYMTTWTDWLDSQNGAPPKEANQWEPSRHYIGTLRDMSTYVHFDQLYQAYFNACLIMLENSVPFDTGLPNAVHSTRGAFASFGGPHILSLMTEVASRALKAVRRQKFQIHRRARPENLAGMLTLAAAGYDAPLDNAVMILMTSRAQAF